MDKLTIFLLVFFIFQVASNEQIVDTLINSKFCQNFILASDLKRTSSLIHDILHKNEFPQIFYHFGPGGLVNSEKIHEFFNREYTFTGDIVQSQIFIYKFHNYEHCSKILVESGQNGEKSITNWLLSSKFALPQRDIFFYIISRKKSGGFHSKSGEFPSKSVEFQSKPGEFLSKTKPGEIQSKPGEFHSNSGEIHSKSKPGEFHSKPGDFHSKSREIQSKSGEFLSISWTSDIKYKFTINPEEIIESNGNCLSFEDRQCKGILQGQKLKVVTVRGPYFARIDPFNKMTSKGIQFIIIKQFSHIYNFTFDIFYSKNGGSGMRTTVDSKNSQNSANSTSNSRNFTWNGCMGSLFYRESDIALAVGLTVFRHLIIDFSTIVAIFDRKFFIRTPLPSTDWRSIFKPFDLKLWILLFITFFICLITFYCLIKNVFHTKYGRDFNSFKVLEEILNSQVRILLEQSATLREFVGARVRWMVFLWTLFSLVLGIGYRAKLLDYLFFLSPQPVPMTHRDLVYSPDQYKMYFRSYGGVALNELRLRASSDPVVALTLKKISIINSSMDCIKYAIVDGKTACMDYSVYGEHAIATNATLNPYDANTRERLFRRSLDSNAVPVLIIMAMRKSSPLLSIFDTQQLRLLSTGLVDFWNRQDWFDARKSSSKWLKTDHNQNHDNDGGSVQQIKDHIEETTMNNDSGGSVRALSINGLLSSFIFTIIGGLLGLLLFLGEITWKGFLPKIFKILQILIIKPTTYLLNLISLNRFLQYLSKNIFMPRSK